MEPITQFLLGLAVFLTGVTLIGLVALAFVERYIDYQMNKHGFYKAVTRKMVLKKIGGE